MAEISQGKQLNVASHKLRREEMQIKSLNFTRSKQVAKERDSANELILKSITRAKAGVPDRKTL